MTSDNPLEMPDNEFDAVMTEIDRELSGSDRPTAGREIAAFCSFCKKYRVSIGIDSPLTDRITKWYERMYGERLLPDWDFGSSVVVLQGGILKLRCIRFYGWELIAASPRLFDENFYITSQDGMRHVMKSIFADRVVGLTPDFARRLSEEERNAALETYGLMFRVFIRLDAALGERYGKSNAPHIKEARHDLLTSAESLVAARPNYGQSKWDSLQAVEKVVKSCILERGSGHRFSHKLADLCAEAAALGVPVVDQALIDAIQCSPGVRYESSSVGKNDAIQAHYAALNVIDELAPTVARTTACASVRELPGTAFKVLALGYSPHDPTK